MADTVDMAVEIEAEHLARGLARVMQPIPEGVSGECDGCGEIMPRLVDGQCGFCRDGRLPPPGWTPPAIPTAILKEPVVMPSKSICLPASETVAIMAVEERAKALSSSIGMAAADLIVAGAQTITAETAPVSAPATLDDLIDMIRERFAEQEQRSVDDAIGDVTARAVAAEQRAEAAEAALARIKAALA